MRRLGRARAPLTPRQVLELVPEIRAALAGEPVAACYLFGSHGRMMRTGDQPGPLSDIDVAILPQPAGTGDGGEWQLRCLGALVDAFRREDVDLVLLDRAPLSLRFAVVRDGYPLLVEDEEQRTRFEQETLRTYRDMEPYRQRFQAARIRRLKEEAT